MGADIRLQGREQAGQGMDRVVVVREWSVVRKCSVVREWSVAREWFVAIRIMSTGAHPWLN